MLSSRRYKTSGRRDQLRWRKWRSENFSIAIAVAFFGRPRAAPINRHSPDSGQFLGQSHSLDRFGQRQIGFVVGKRRSKPAVDRTATLIRAVLPESRHASPLVDRAFDLPGSSCRRGWCSQPGDQGQDFSEHLSRDCDLGLMPREPGSVRSIDYDKAAWIVPRFGGDPVVSRPSDLAHVVRVSDRVMFQIYH